VVSMGGWKGPLTCGGVCGCSGESALVVVEEATAEAAKHGDRSERLVALVAEARGMIEQARAGQAERARAAAEEAEAAAAVKEQVAAITLRVQNDMLMLQQAQAQLGSSVAPPAAPAPPDDDAVDQCVLCFDAPKDHIILPCYHVCVCEACASLLTQMKKPSCPICRTAIEHTNKVFHS
jgi:hypothetical protein